MTTSLSAQRTLARHGRSFRWAQVFLARQAAADAAVLYALCREIDDLADESPDAETASRGLDRLGGELRGTLPASDTVRAALDVLHRTGGSPVPALLLLETARTDLGPVRIPDDDALVAYARGVAGTVGCMMAPLLGATGTDAIGPAESLGVAMQITNICRDVREDAARDRVYLPATRLAAAGLVDPLPADLFTHRDAVARVVADLLDLADLWYARARAGYPRLPLRSRVAVQVAAALYRGIGHRLRRVHRSDPMGGRTVVPSGERLLLVSQALFSTLIGSRT